MPAMPDPRTLGDLPLFRNLAPADLAYLNDRLHRVTFPAGAAILTTDQPAEVAYVVLAGTLKVHLLQADGSDVTLALLGPGEMVGELGLVDRLGRSANVVALEPAALLWLDRATFQECRRVVPALTDNLLALLARRLRLANAQLLALATLDVYGRVARQLTALADAYGERTPDGATRIPMRLTQGDLASLVGATRVRVNQVIVAFKRWGAIEVDPQHRVTIRKPEVLAQYTE